MQALHIFNLFVKSVFNYPAPTIPILGGLLQDSIYIEFIKLITFF